jgi:hypothetical protein
MACVVQSWKAWSLGRDVTEDTNVPVILRRRVSLLGQNALSLAWPMSASNDARFVVSSRHGEFGRTASILESIAAETDISPADFTLSVHHALAGLLSIARNNRRGHTAIAAGRESFCFGFLEALAILAEGTDDRVILIHYDEPLPMPFSTFNDADELAASLVMVLSASGDGLPVSLSIAPSTAAPTEMRGTAAVRFRAFLEGETASRCRFVGQRLSWDWSHEPASP